MVFAGPPEDDIDWADMCPGGSLKFLQRAWRLSGDVTSEVGTPACRRGRRAAPGHPPHRAEAEQLIESHRFNVLVARTMELVNATRKAIDSGCGPADPAVREAAETVAILLSPGRAVHRGGDVGAAGPRADRRPRRLAGGRRGAAGQESVTAVVQVQGKVKARLEVSPEISEADLEAAAMADDAVQRALDGQDRPQGDRAGAQAGQHRRRLTRFVVDESAEVYRCRPAADHINPWSPRTQSCLKAASKDAVAGGKSSRRR